MEKNYIVHESLQLLYIFPYRISFSPNGVLSLAQGVFFDEVKNSTGTHKGSDSPAPKGRNHIVKMKSMRKFIPFNV